MVIAVFLLYAGEAASRIRRETRATRVRENSEIAYYAAEAGLNRVRAWMITQAPPDKVELLHGRGGTIPLAAGVPGGTYTLIVIRNADDSFTVVSEGTYGSGSAQARRVIRGVLRVVDTKWNGDKVVESTYMP